MKRSWRIPVFAGFLGISALLMQPTARAQAGFYFGIGGARASVAIAVPPCPGPGYAWMPGYYDGPAWVPGYWAWRGDDDGGYYGFRGGDDGYWRRGDDGGY